MRQPVLLISLLLAVLPASVLTQNPVPIQFQTDPVLVQTGTQIVFTVLTVPEVLSMTWQYQAVTLGLWAGGAAVINPVPQFQGRVTITATQLQIGGAQLRDAGNYTVMVTPIVTTGLATNSRTVNLRVFDAVAGVTLVVPSVAIENRNVSLSCTWTAGTEVNVQWGKNDVAIIADSRITISGGSLIINPATRNDTGTYTCTVSNPVSAQTASRSLTVYYGPDTPVLTKETPKQCVGRGDVQLGQAVRLTCTSNSLPPALFSWQYNGQPVASDQANSGVLTLQTFTINQSGQYVCMARNTISGVTSQQGTSVAIVDVCLNVGEVVGIVIGCLLFILLIVLLILLILYLRRKRRAEERQGQTVVIQNTNPNTRPIATYSQPNGAREQPPLYHTNTHRHHPDRLYTAQRERRDDPRTLQPNSLYNFNARPHNGRTHTNGLLHNAIQSTNSNPHNGIDNPAFTHTNVQNANTLPNTQRQNPNVLIQAGAGQGSNQPAAVHVNLNTLPQTAQQDNNAQMPTIHVNVNSYPTDGQWIQQDRSLPHTNSANSNAPRSHTEQVYPRRQSGQFYPSDPRLNGYIDTDLQAQPDLIPTGYTHYNSNNTSQRNANTQTYQQDMDHRSRSDRRSESHSATPSSSLHQMPWDRLRGTPAYHSSTLQREQFSPEYTSDNTDYTTHPPIPESRSVNRSRPQPWNQTASRSRNPTRQNAPPVDRRKRTRSADPHSPNTRHLTQLEATPPTHRGPRTQSESAQQDIRGLPGSQTAPRQEATHRNNPQGLSLMSQQESVGRSAMSQEPRTQQGLTAPWSADTRALVDPNHLPQAHVLQQQREAPIRKPPEDLGTQIIHGVRQPRQGDTVPYPSAQPDPRNLTQAALKAHTDRTQIFHNRKQQTQAALLHPGTQHQAPAAGAEHPPTPPPVIPLTQFKTIPKDRTQHKSPTRGPQPSRPPVNMPVAHGHQQHRPNVHHHPAAHHHHHRPGNGHMHAPTNRHAHAPTHRHPADFSHPQQQQAHRGRPR